MLLFNLFDVQILEYSILLKARHDDLIVLLKYKNIGIIAYESGITGAYNLIDSLMPNYDNSVKIINFNLS